MAGPLVKIKRLRDSAIALPAYHSAGAAGMDLRADIERPEVLAPMERRAIPTGVAIQLPEGFEGQVRARSGLALSQGIGLLNAPGTIDADYRGEIRVLLINYGQQAVMISPGDRIAQLVIAPVARAELSLVQELDPSDRGDGGFGHTGR